MSVPVAATLSADQVSARSRSSFLVSFLFLGRARRAALTAVYAFCRVVDDAVDDAESPQQGEEHLRFWRAELERVYAGSPETGVGRALAEAVRDFGVPRAALEQVLDGVAMDLSPAGFADLPELEAYCRKVASAVGRACLPVFGVGGPAAERYADSLGLALQLTNVLRDLAEDAATGRVYVPRRWLQECGVQPAWLSGSHPPAAAAPGGPLARLVERLHGEAARRFAEARSALAGMPWRDRRRVLPARVMGAVYADLLRGLLARGGRIGGGRLRLGRARKAWLCLRTLLGAGG